MHTQRIADLADYIHFDKVYTSDASSAAIVTVTFESKFNIFQENFRPNPSRYGLTAKICQLKLLDRHGYLSWFKILA